MPCPQVGRGQILIQTRSSLISAGTERMLIEFSQANLIQKARQQPEKVKQVLEKMRTDGLMPTLDAVFRKLDEPLPLGYCNAGVVLEVGHGVHDIRQGDRVASNSPHAEIASVPRNLCAKIPDSVPDEEAAFTVLGSVALQGVRLALPTLGERFVVFGMGLLGLLTTQLLRASGCRVLAVDLSEERLKYAKEFGAKTVNIGAGGDPIAAVQAWTAGRGVDGAIITATAKTDAIIHQAAESCRKRGRIILVGVVGLNLRRDDFFEKELSFQVSCSYGPGRFDEKYEQEGQDYPEGYVRWTEERNFGAILEAIADGALNVKSLITHRFKLVEMVTAYDKIQNDSGALGVVLEYPTTVARTHSVRIEEPEIGEGQLDHRNHGEHAVVGVIGAGNFAVSTILPAVRKTQARLKYVAGWRHGVAVQHAAKKFQAEQAVTEHRLLLEDPDVNTIFIITRHDTHAGLICETLRAGKHVFVEKPLCLTQQELQDIRELYTGLDSLRRPHLMVGFNRRFSSHIVRAKELLEGRSEPLTMTMTVNAGPIPLDHWTQDPERGGGRIIGEACHFIDLFVHLTNAPVVRVAAMQVGDGTAVHEDKMSILLSFADGSVGSVHYFANGSKGFPKETLEVFSDGRVLRLENFRLTRGYGFKGFSKFKTRRQDKGHAAEIAQFIQLIDQGGRPLIQFKEIANVTEATLSAVEAAHTGQTVSIEA